MLSSISQDTIDPISYWRDIMDKVKKPAAQAERTKLSLHLPMGFPKKYTAAKKRPPLTEAVLGFKQTYPTKVIITRVSLCACVSCPLAAIAVLWCSISWLGRIHLRVPSWPPL